MKLKDQEKTPNQKFQKYLLPLAVIFCIYIFLDSTSRIGFSFNFLLMTLPFFIIIIVTAYLVTDHLNQDYEYLKDIGEQLEGTIIGYGNSYNHVKGQNYIVVQYDNNKKKKIKFLERNSAFLVLELILERFSETEIPIDIYKKGFKIYADLESVNLSKLKNFEEASKFVEKSFT